MPTRPLHVLKTLIQRNRAFPVHAVFPCNCDYQDYKFEHSSNMTSSDHLSLLLPLTDPSGHAETIDLVMFFSMEI